MSVIIILLLPLIAAALVFIPFKKCWAQSITVVSNAAVLILAARIALRVSAGSSVVSTLKIGLLKWFSVDGLSALILLLIAFVATIAAIYSVGYMARENLKPRKLRLYYANYNLFIFSMLAIPVLADPTLVWIAVELTTLSSALLVSFENTPEALEAAW
jgi:hydrogenase-4 component F